MDAGPSVDHRGDGWSALEAAEWEAARTAFEAALALEPEAPDALDGHGLAIWFLGDVEGGIAERERAFAGYARDQRCDDAARTAVWVSHQHLIGGRTSAARGWLARAERVVEDIGDCRGRGWVAVERARHGASAGDCLDYSERAMAIAREHGDGDLEVFALSLLGRAHVEAGDLQLGMQLLEEAMAAATAGRVSNVFTLGDAYCNLIAASTGAGQWECASEWCALVDAFAREHGASLLLGECRRIHADVLLAAGRWTDAEQALEAALEMQARLVPAMRAPTMEDGGRRLRTHLHNRPPALAPARPCRRPASRARARHHGPASTDRAATRVGGAAADAEGSATRSPTPAARTAALVRGRGAQLGG